MGVDELVHRFRRHGLLAGPKHHRLIVDVVILQILGDGDMDPLGFAPIVVDGRHPAVGKCDGSTELTLQIGGTGFAPGPAGVLGNDPVIVDILSLPDAPGPGPEGGVDPSIGQHGLHLVGVVEAFLRVVANDLHEESGFDPKVGDARGRRTSHPARLCSKRSTSSATPTP